MRLFLFIFIEVLLPWTNWVLAWYYLMDYLEDHPRTRKWLITMVIVSPLNGVIALINGLFMAYKWGLITTY